MNGDKFISCRRRHEPDKLGISRQVPEELCKSESPGPSRGYPGNEAEACLSVFPKSARRRKYYGCSMWGLLPLSAFLLFSSFAVTFCEDQKEADNGSIVRARLEVSEQYYILRACFESMLVWQTQGFDFR